MNAMALVHVPGLLAMHVGACAPFRSPSLPWPELGSAGAEKGLEKAFISAPPPHFLGTVPLPFLSFFF